MEPISSLLFWAPAGILSIVLLLKRDAIAQGLRRRYSAVNTKYLERGESSLPERQIPGRGVIMILAGLLGAMWLVGTAVSAAALLLR